MTHWTARYLKPIVFVTVALTAAGILLALRIPISVFPQTNFPRIVVGVDNGVMPIDQMQVAITRPLEQALNSVQGLRQVRSITSRGSAEIDLFFTWNSDMFQTLQRVNAAIASVQPTLPSTASITANRLTFAAFPILGYSLTSNRASPVELWNLATYSIKPRLNRLYGVSSVTIQGGAEPEFEIDADSARMVAAQITVQNILDAVSRSNLIDSPGLLEHNHQLVLTLVSGQAHNARDVGNIVIKTSAAGVPIRIADIATVRNSVKPTYTIVRADAQPAVLLNINRQPDSNTVQVAAEVDAELARIQKSLPEGTKISTFYDQSALVRASIASVRDAILIGILLAAGTMALFLRDWASSVIAALVIPVTIAITCIALYLLGESFDLMTLGGLAAAVGLVIDDAIVVVENIVLHRSLGQTRGDAVRSALSELRVPLVGSTITPIVVFLPLITISGVTGVFFRALAITVAVALLTSLALALTWTPSLSEILMRGEPKHTPNHQNALTRRYERVLRFSIAHPIALAVAAVVLVGVSFGCYKALGTDLLPSMDEGGFILDYLMPAGSSLTDTDRVLQGVQKILQSVPEVENTSRRTGLQLGLAAVTEANTGDFSVKLKSHRSRSVQEVIADIRKQVNDRYPQLDTDFTQVLQDMIGDLTSSPDPVEIKLFSENVDLLRTWGAKVGDEIKKIPEIKDVKNGIEDTISGPALTFRVNEDAAARSGFAPQEIEVDTSALMQGEPATTPVIVNGRPWGVRVKIPTVGSGDISALTSTVLVSQTGGSATVGALAATTYDPGQLEVRRENLQRDIAVTARLEGVSLGTGIQKVQTALSHLNIPPAIRVELGGLYAEQQQSFHDLIIVLIAAIILIFAVLLLEFREFGAAVGILTSAVLSTSGVFLALLITGTTFNVSSFMGLVMVIGIVAKNGILLLDAEQHYRSEGSSGIEAVVQAGERRLRPILMTATASVAGMLPLAFAIGSGSEMLKPLAVSVIGGVIASIPLSLIVTPVVHRVLTHRHAL